MALSPNGFQNVVNAKPAPGVVGDFASVNPRASVLGGNGNLHAPAGGLVVGNFAFRTPAPAGGSGSDSVSQSYSSGSQIGFLGRNLQALITTFLGQASLVVPSGFMVTLFDQGEFFAMFEGGATAGQTVYADETTGAPVSGGASDTVTASAGFTGTASFAAAIMTVATVTAGVVSVGDTVTGTGVPAGTTVIALGTGTGGVGTYALSGPASTEAAEATTTTSLVLHVTAELTGGLSVGDVITGTGVTAGTKITSVPVGSGIGAYGLSVAQNFASTTVTASGGNIATGFTVATNCNPGELAIISTWGG